MSPVAGTSNRAALGAIGAFMVVALWELAARLVWNDTQVLPSPTQAIAAAWGQLSALELAQHVGWSLWRILAGFALGAGAGIALGVAAGWYAGAEAQVDGPFFKGWVGPGRRLPVRPPGWVYWGGPGAAPGVSASQPRGRDFRWVGLQWGVERR